MTEKEYSVTMTVTGDIEFIVMAESAAEAAEKASRMDFSEGCPDCFQDEIQYVCNVETGECFDEDGEVIG